MPERIEPIKRKRAAPPPTVEVEDDEIDEDPSDDDDEEVLSLTPPEPAKASYAKVPPKKIETLEDLYAVYPTIGDGVFRLRIERTGPKAYGGQHIAGWIADLDEKPSMEELFQTFGGGKYNVMVLGPANGRADTRTLFTLELSIPGPPNMSFLPQAQDPAMNGRFNPQMATEPASVQIKRMDMEERQIARLEQERTRLQQEAFANRTAPDHVVKALTAQSDKTVTELKSLADSQIQLLREQAQTLMNEVNRKESELREIRNQLVTERQSTVEARMKAEIDIERKLKESHEAVIQALTKKHDEAIASLKEQSNREIRDIETRSRERMEEASRRYQEDLTRSSVNSTNEIERIRRDVERSEKNLKETYEARIADLQRSTEREVRSIVEQRDREISALKLTYESSEKFSQQSVGMRLDTMRSEVDRLRSEAERLRVENDTLRAAQNKDPQTYLRETREVAETLLGMVPKSEIESNESESEEPFDWKKEAAKGAISLLSQAPAIAEKFAGSFGGGQQQQQQQMPPQMMGQPQMMGMMPGPMPMGRPGLPPGPPRMISPVAPEIPFRPPQPRRHAAPAPQFVPQEPVQAPVQAAPAPQAFQPPPQAFATSQQAFQPQATSAPVPEAPQAQAAESPELAELNAFGEAFSEFISEMEKAIQSEIIAPDVFARGFIGRVGPDAARSLLQQIPVASFIEVVEGQSNGASVIITRDGKQYARSVWSEAAKQLGGA